AIFHKRSNVQPALRVEMDDVVETGNHTDASGYVSVTPFALRFLGRR
ncbi:MAG: hypothetical protein JWL57_3487, partial [Actinobacteria bacterium]|nr:hypothetical protein [Actinomycetota bacterium]